MAARHRLHGAGSPSGSIDVDKDRKSVHDGLTRLRLLSISTSVFPGVTNVLGLASPGDGWRAPMRAPKGRRLEIVFEAASRGKRLNPP